MEDLKIKTQNITIHELELDGCFIKITKHEGEIVEIYAFDKTNPESGTFLKAKLFKALKVAINLIEK